MTGSLNHPNTNIITFYSADTDTANYLCREKTGKQFGYWRYIYLPTQTAWDYWNLAIIGFNPKIP